MSSFGVCSGLIFLAICPGIITKGLPLLCLPFWCYGMRPSLLYSYFLPASLSVFVFLLLFFVCFFVVVFLFCFFVCLFFLFVCFFCLFVLFFFISV